MDTRNPVIDLAKLVAILLVVYGHILTPDNGVILTCIAMSHMPLFFAVSGYFLYRECKRYTAGKLLKKKVMRLLLPYVVWSAVSLFANSARIVAQGGSDIPAKLFSEAGNIFLYARSVWFLVVLFFSSVVFIFLYNISERRKGKLLWLLLGCYLLFFMILPNNILMLYKFKWLFPFLVAGYYWAKNEHIFSTKIKDVFRKYGGTTLVLYPIYGALIVWGGGGEGRDPFRNAGICSDFQPIAGALYLVGGCLGIGMIFSIAFLLFGRHLFCLTEVGQYTLDVYVIHMFLISFCRKIPRELIPQNVWYVLAFLYATVTVACIFFFSKHLLRKFKIYRWSIGMS